MLTLIIVKFLSSLSCSLAYSGFLKGIFCLADTLHYSSCYPMSCTLICCSCYVCRQLFHCFFFTKHVKFSPFFFLEVPKQLSTHHLVLSVSQLLCFSYPDDILSDITNIFQRWSTLAG